MFYVDHIWISIYENIMNSTLKEKKTIFRPPWTQNTSLQAVFQILYFGTSGDHFSWQSIIDNPFDDPVKKAIVAAVENYCSFRFLTTLIISISSMIFKNFHSTKNIHQILLPKISHWPEEFLHAHTRITYKSSKLPLKGRPLLVLFVITTFKMALGFLMLLYRVMKMDILSDAPMVCTSIGNYKVTNKILTKYI